MKIRIQFKTPDALEDAIKRTCEDEIGGSSNDEDLDDQYNALVEKTMKLASRWFRYNELLTVVIDTEKETCIVEKV